MPTWPGEHLQLTDEQVMALVQGLPWQRLGDAGVNSGLYPNVVSRAIKKLGNRDQVWSLAYCRL